MALVENYSFVHHKKFVVREGVARDGLSWLPKWFSPRPLEGTERLTLPLFGKGMRRKVYLRLSGRRKEKIMKEGNLPQRLFFKTYGGTLVPGRIVSDRPGPMAVGFTGGPTEDREVFVVGASDGRWVALRHDRPWGASYATLGGDAPDAASFPERFTNWAQEVRREAVQAVIDYIDHHYPARQAARLVREVHYANTWWIKMCRVEAWRGLAETLGARTRIGESWGQVHAAPAKIASRLGMRLPRPMPAWVPMPGLFEANTDELPYLVGDIRLEGDFTITRWSPFTPPIAQKATVPPETEEVWDAE